MSGERCKKKVKLWQSQAEYECQETALLGDSYCVLHSEDESKDLKDFKQKVEGRISIADDPESVIDLRGCYFPKGFGSNYFSDRPFYGFVDFSGAVFSHETSFAGAKFLHGADFFQAEFRGKVDFLKTSVERQKTNFREAKFKSGVNFWDTQFKCEEVSFSDAEFIEEGEVKFDATHFDCQAYFIKTKFKKYCKFWWSEFPRTHKQAVFENTDLRECSFLYSNIDKIDFRYCKFGSNYTFVIRHPLSKYIVKHIPIKKLGRLLYWSFLRPTNVLKDELDAEELVETRDKKEREKIYEHVRRLYLELKRNFEDKKDWNTAGDFHYGEMECRRKMKGWFSLEGLYFLVSGYGERPLRASVVLFVLICLFFPAMYVIFERDPFWVSVWDSFRVATFMRIGTPIEPDTGLGKFFLALESILCPTQFALFALALRRKVKR